MATSILDLKRNDPAAALALWRAKAPGLDRRSRASLLHQLAMLQDDPAELYRAVKVAETD